MKGTPYICYVTVKGYNIEDTWIGFSARYAAKQATTHCTFMTSHIWAV